MEMLDIGLSLAVLILIIVLIIYFITRIKSARESKHEGIGYFAIAGAIIAISIFLPIPWWVLVAVSVIFIMLYIGGSHIEKGAKRGTKEERQLIYATDPNAARRLRQLERKLAELETEKSGPNKELKEEIIREIELQRHNLATVDASKVLSETILSMEGKEKHIENVVEKIEHQVERVENELGKMTNISALDEAGKKHVSELLSTNIELQNRLIAQKEEKAELVDERSRLIEEVSNVLKDSTTNAVDVARAVHDELKDVSKAGLEKIKKTIKEIKGKEGLSEEARKTLEREKDELYKIHGKLEGILHEKSQAIRNIVLVSKELENFGKKIEDLGDANKDAAGKYKDNVDKARKQQDAIAKEFEELVAKRAGPAQLASSSIKRIAQMYNSLITAVYSLMVFERNLKSIADTTKTINEKIELVNISMRKAANLNGQLAAAYKDFNFLVNAVKENAGEVPAPEDMFEEFATDVEWVSGFEERIEKFEFKLSKDIVESLSKVSEEVETSAKELEDEDNDLRGLRDLVVDSLRKIAAQVVKQQARINKEFKTKAEGLLNQLNSSEERAKQTYRYAKAARRV